MKGGIKKILLLTILVTSLGGGILFGQPMAVQGAVGTATLFLSPRSETVLEGSTFDISIFVNSHGSSINAVELNLKFPTDKLSIVKPSGGKSFISLWVAPPSFSNTNGSVTFSGVVPGGITTEAGLVSTITFQAKASGEAIIEVLGSSKVLANDGSGTAMNTEFGKGVFTITPKPPEGVRVFSETHPFEQEWYNNNSPVLSWEKGVGIDDFSYVFDNKPLTTPDNIPETQDTVTTFENVADGVWYFHIKAKKNNIWGATTHFRVSIDTVPPADFSPALEIVRGSPDKVLVSFFTSDALSGVDHYEVGVIDKKQSANVSPVFVETTSPYQVPSNRPEDQRVIVRVIDRAGNVVDEGLNIVIPSVSVALLKKNATFIYGLLLLILLLLIIIHYLLRHHIFRLFRQIMAVIRKEKAEEKMSDQKREKHEKEMLDSIKKH